MSRGDDPVNLLEASKVVWIGVERAFEGLDGLRRCAELLGEDVAGGHIVGTSRRGLGDFGETLEQLHAGPPLLRLGEQLQQPMHDRPLFRPHLQRLSIGGDGTLRVVAAIAVNGGHCLQQLALHLAILGDSEQTLRVANHRIVVAGRFGGLESRLEETRAARLVGEDLLEAGERPGWLPGPHPGHTQALLVVGELGAAESQRMLGEQRLIGSSRVGPGLARVRKAGEVTADWQRLGAGGLLRERRQVRLASTLWVSGLLARAGQLVPEPRTLAG